MAIRENVVNGLVAADGKRVEARAMEKGAAREQAWQAAMDEIRNLEENASPEEKAAAEAVIMQGANRR